MQKDKLPRAFCVAKSIRHAEETMRVDWGWEPFGTVRGVKAFKSPRGEVVTPVSDCQNLYGTYTPVYFGYLAHEARAFDDFIAWYDNRMKGRNHAESLRE